MERIYAIHLLFWLIPAVVTYDKTKENETAATLGAVFVCSGLTFIINLAIKACFD